MPQFFLLFRRCGRPPRQLGFRVPDVEEVVHHDPAADRLLIPSRPEHAQPSGDPERTFVLRANIGDHPPCVPPPEREVQTFPCPLRRIAAVLKLLPQHPADAEMGAAFDLLRNQSDLADRLAGLPLDRQPVSTTILPVAGERPLEPALHLTFRKRVLPGVHHFNILQHRPEHRQIRRSHLPQNQPFRRKDNPP